MMTHRLKRGGGPKEEAEASRLEMEATRLEMEASRLEDEAKQMGHDTLEYATAKAARTAATAARTKATEARAVADQQEVEDRSALAAERADGNSTIETTRKERDEKRRQEHEDKMRWKRGLYN